MTYHTLFTAQPPVASSRLPLTLISLDDWALVTLTGADRVKYLQGQVTADIDDLTVDQHVLCAHCDAKGKMWSNLRLFYHGEGLAFIERRSLLDNQLSELKKYAVFSKVVITSQPEAVLLGIAGAGAKATLAQVFTELPSPEHPVVQQGNSTLLHFSLPAERFLLVTDVESAQQWVETLSARAQFNNSKQWLALDIEAGFAIIDSDSSAQFIPQATNIQALNGISFNKGCYSGQEMVARAKYRGANKRALYWLAGNASRVPAVGEDLEWQLGENWRRTGSVLAALVLSDGTVWVQAVLNNDLAVDSVLRVRDDVESVLTIQPLPYSLTEDK